MVALYGVTLVFAAAGTFRDALVAMTAGLAPAADRVVSSEEMGEIVGVPECLAADQDVEE
jgi:hypothetical protein